MARIIKYFKNNIIILLILIALSSALGYFSVENMPEMTWSDETEYHTVGQNLAFDGFYDTSRRVLAPGYPFFVAGVYKIFGPNYEMVYHFQFFIIGLIAFLTGLIARKYFKISLLWSYLISIAIIIWPYFVLYANLLRTEVLNTLFVILTFYFLLEFARKPSMKNSFLIAFFAAYGTLIRPMTLLLPFWVAGIWLIILFVWKKYSFKNTISYLKEDKKRAYLIGTSVILFYFFLSPWILFISAQEGRFVPVASNLKAVNWRANGSYDYEYGVYKTPGYEPGAEVTFTKTTISKTRNIYRFWKSGAWGYQSDAVVNKFPQARYLIYLYRIGFYLLVVLALLSIFFMKRKKELALIWIVIFYAWLFHTVFFPYPRYTLPFIPITIVLAVYSLTSIIPELVKNKFPKNNKSQ